jgi:hypothetical protein
MDHDLRFTRATRRRSPLPILSTVGLVLLLILGFLADVGREAPGRRVERSAQVT